MKGENLIKYDIKIRKIGNNQYCYCNFILEIN